MREGHHKWFQSFNRYSKWSSVHTYYWTGNRCIVIVTLPEFWFTLPFLKWRSGSHLSLQIGNFGYLFNLSTFGLYLSSFRSVKVNFIILFGYEHGFLSTSSSLEISLQKLIWLELSKSSNHSCKEFNQINYCKAGLAVFWGVQTP